MKFIEGNLAASGHYSAGVISGNTLYISGQLPVDPETGSMVQGIEMQTRQCLLNIESVLEAAGLKRSDIIMCRAFTEDHSYWAAINEEYAKFFGDHKPARIIMPVKALRPGLLIEIEAVAECRNVD